MTPSLERLAELVRQAEAKTRARKIEAETLHASELFRAAELRARRCVEKLRGVRPASLRALEQADADEHLLKDLVRKLAQFKSSLASESDAETLIATSQAEIERTRKQARADLEEVAREVEEARKDLRVAIDQYRNLRRELDRLQPELAERFGAEDRLLWDAEGHFTGGQLQLLAQEVEAGVGAFASLTKLEQYARLKVWIGRFRNYQSAHERENEGGEELQALGHRVFHQLKWLSRQYEPGYIEAFRQDYSTDWSAYVAEAQEQLHQAVEAGRRAREAADVVRTRDPQGIPGRSPASGPNPPPAGPSPGTPGMSGGTPLDSLRSLLSRANLPQDGLQDFLDALTRAVTDLGPEDPELLQTILPYRDYIEDQDGLGTLRRNLDLIQDSVTDGTLPSGTTH